MSGDKLKRKRTAVEQGDQQNAVNSSFTDEDGAGWLFTQLPHIIKWLQEDYHKKGSKCGKKFSDIVSYISIPSQYSKTQTLLTNFIQDHPSIQVIAKGVERNNATLYRYKPKLPITNSNDLLAYLAKGDSPIGLTFADLKDSWLTDCAHDLDLLEAERRIIITRNKKLVPIMVFLDNPNLYLKSLGKEDEGKASEDFVKLWHDEKMPDLAKVHEVLKDVSIAATSKKVEEGTVRAVKKRAGGGRRKMFSAVGATNEGLFERGELKVMGKK